MDWDGRDPGFEEGICWLWRLLRDRNVSEILRMCEKSCCDD